MQEKEQEITGGSLYYEVKKDEVCITRYRGLSSEITVPDCLEGCPVTIIGKKAFLSNKNLRRVQLPAGIREVEDWAFAYCDGLREVQIPKAEIRFGKAVFMECKRLERITDFGKDSALLGAAVTAFDAYYMLDLFQVGTPQWLSMWDAKLVNVLHTPDTEGYSKQVLCGEEDYGSTDLDAYTSERRKEKVRLAMLRLLCDQGLSDSLREELREYLLSHTKGCVPNGTGCEETWLVVWREHGNDREYYELFAELGCITDGNRNEILADIGEECPEMKAYFLNFGERNDASEQFFSGLDL